MKDKPEIVIALVSPVGVDLDSIMKIFSDYLAQFGYNVNVIKLSSCIDKIDGLETDLAFETENHRIDSYMTAGDEARKKSERGDILAALSLPQHMLNTPCSWPFPPPCVPAIWRGRWAQS